MKKNILLLSALMAVGPLALASEAYGQTPLEAQAQALLKLAERSKEFKEQYDAAAAAAASKQNSPPSQSSTGNTPPPPQNSTGNTSPPQTSGNTPPPVNKGTLKTLTLTNQSSQPLGNITITFSGTDAGDFSQMNNCGGSLAAGGSCTISVIFLPKTSGPKSATMEITSSGGGQAVYLTGTGT